ncbi:unnamed protein product, partial [Ectocarpus sp. 12 AP-2014]
MPAGISSSVLCAMRFRSLDVSAPSDLMLLETCHATSCCLPCRAPTQDATWYGTAVIQASTLFRNCRMHGAQLQQTLGCADQHKIVNCAHTAVTATYIHCYSGLSPHKTPN